MENENPNFTILSADDDENAHLLLKRAFGKAGAKSRLITVNDGYEAIRYLSGEGEFRDRKAYPLPDIFLLDLKMPGLSGFDVLEHLREKPPVKKFPVVVFSTSNHEADIQKAHLLGCHSYVVKPAGFDQLIELVRLLEKEFSSADQADSPVSSAFSRFRVQPPMIHEQFDDTRNNSSMNGQMTESPEMFRLLVEQVKDYAIFLLDRNGHILSWNEGARRIKGYSDKEIIGKHFSTFYPKTDIENEKPQLELRVAREMGKYEEEGWRLRKDGSRFWANVVITPLRGPDGQLSGFAKVTRDLTQRKLQEESFHRLLESEERFRLLVEQVKDYAIFILDVKGFVASWNQGARHIKGYSSDEIIGKHFSIFYPMEDIQAGKPSIELSVVIREGRYEEEGWRIRKDGTRFWASVIITALWDKGGKLTGFAKVTRDLSDRKEEEDALRQKTMELENFAHTISHDLRAPLRSISSFSQILKSDAKELSEKEKEVFLEKIARAAHSMESLIHDILRISEMGQTPISEHEVLLSEVLDECLSLLESEIKRTNAQIDIRKPLPLLKGDRSLLIQIFSNLLANALKFVPADRTPRIEIHTHNREGHCEIHVKDHGTGIPEEYHESIFNLFERGAVGREYSGTGLGLAIVKKAVERIGGKIELKSHEGEGSDFILTLRCALPKLVPVTEAA